MELRRIFVPLRRTASASRVDDKSSMGPQSTLKPFAADGAVHAGCVAHHMPSGTGLRDVPAWTRLWWYRFELATSIVGMDTNERRCVCTLDILLDLTRRRPHGCSFCRRRLPHCGHCFLLKLFVHQTIRVIITVMQLLM